MGDPAAGASALVWSVTAMSETMQRLSRVAAADQPHGLTVISEAVWWVTIVDATLVRHHPAAYDRVMKGLAPAQRELTEGTLAGLRFVRNQIGGQGDPGEFVEPGTSSPRASHAWTWRPAPQPALASLPPRGREWEKARHHSYQAQLASHTVGETLGRAAAFLRLAAANAQAITDASVLSRAPASATADGTQRAGRGHGPGQ